MASSRVNLYMGRAFIPEGNNNAEHLYTQDTQAFLWQFVQRAAKAKGKGKLKGKGKGTWGSFVLDENGPDGGLVTTFSCNHEVAELCSICMPSEILREQLEAQLPMTNIEAQPQRIGYADWTFPTKGKGKGKPTTGTNSRSRSR